MMNFSSLTAYFEQLSSAHKQIAHSEQERHFFRINIDQLITGFRQDIHFPAVMLELPEGRILGTTLDTLFMTRFVGLSFLDKLEIQNHEAELDCYDRMEQLGLDFLSRIRRDYQTFSDRFISYLDLSDIRCYKVGPIHHNCFGVRFELTVGDPSLTVMHYNPSNWLEQ